MIIRGPRPESNFYILDKRISQDKRLSWAARGLLIYLLGKPDNWRVSVTDLVNQTAESARASGRDAVYGMLKELQVAGYVTVEQPRKDDGTMGAVTYNISENGCTSIAGADQPLTDLPVAANPTLTSIESLSSTEVPNTDVELAFDRWRELFNKSGAKLDDKRRRCIAKAVKSHGIQKVLDCLAGYTKSKFHMGENDRNTKYDDIALFLRDATNIERGLELNAQPKRSTWI